MAKDMVNYTVVVETKNGARILGARRTKGETFDAVPNDVHFLELEGVIAPTKSLEPAPKSPALPDTGAH